MRPAGLTFRGVNVPNKTPFVTAVSVNEKSHPIAMNMNVVNGFRSKEIARWAKHHFNADSYVVSDGLACFTAVKDAGCQHTCILIGGGPECVSLESFTWVNTMIGNVKRSINEAYHAINQSIYAIWQSFVTASIGGLFLRICFTASLLRCGQNSNYAYAVVEIMGNQESLYAPAADGCLRAKYVCRFPKTTG